MGFEWITSIYLWLGLALFFLIAFGISLIFLIIFAKKTHAIVEFKAWRKGVPISVFFQENRYVDWRPVIPEAGIIQDPDYGAYIINERATYIDKRTKNIIIPFDASVASSINVHAAKLADDIQYIVKDDEEMKKLRFAISNSLIDDSTTIDVLKTSVHFGAIKNMVTAMIPHNVNAKIEKIIAARMKSYGKINVPQVVLVFAGVFGAILLGALVIKLAFGE